MSAAVWSWADVEAAEVLALPAPQSYPIESGIPIPPRARPAGLDLRGSERFPLEALRVGQSFWVPEEDGRAARSHACVVSNQTGRRFVSRAVDGGVRLWRVA